MKWNYASVSIKITRHDQNEGCMQSVQACSNYHEQSVIRNILINYKWNIIFAFITSVTIVRKEMAHSASRGNSSSCNVESRWSIYASLKQNN